MSPAIAVQMRPGYEDTGLSHDQRKDSRCREEKRDSGSSDNEAKMARTKSSAAQPRSRSGTPPLSEEGDVMSLDPIQHEQQSKASRSPHSMVRTREVVARTENHSGAAEQWNVPNGIRIGRCRSTT